MNHGTSTDDRYAVPALMRGLTLLTQFSRDEKELTGAELARRLGAPRASVFRLLHTLEQLGFVERVGDAPTFRLGVGVLRLGFEYLASMELTELGMPVLDALRDATGFSAHLVVRDGIDAVFVAKAPGHQALFHSIQVGARLPVHATVVGRTLLAGMDLKALTDLLGTAPLKTYTAYTPATVKKLKALVDADLAQGYGVSQGGFETGISTIASAVRNQTGQVLAALSITVPAQTIAPTQLAQLTPQVCAAAAQLSDRMRHFPQHSGTPRAAVGGGTIPATARVPSRITSRPSSPRLAA